LEPEEGDTLVVGAVVLPPFAPGLTASIDYFDIEVDGLVGVINPNITLRECMQSGDPVFCDLIQRGEGGTLFATPDSYISTLNVNTGSLTTKGVDVAVNYPVDMSSLLDRNLGQLNVSLIGTYLDEYSIKSLPTSPAEDVFDCAGYHGFSCGHPKPKWRHYLTTVWETPWLEGLEFGATWRYIGKADISRRSGHPALQGAASETQDLDSRSYLDLNVFWPATDHLMIRAGVNNAFDEEPSLTTEFVGAEGGRGNTYGAFYDYMGRLLFVTASVDF
jgi:outer membrane receptor protein involved in Fe transport